MKSLTAFCCHVSTVVSYCFTLNAVQRQTTGRLLLWSRYRKRSVFATDVSTDVHFLVSCIGREGLIFAGGKMGGEGAFIVLLYEELQAGDRLLLQFVSTSSNPLLTLSHYSRHECKTKSQQNGKKPHTDVLLYWNTVTSTRVLLWLSGLRACSLETSCWTQWFRLGVLMMLRNFFLQLFLL